jgi:RNA polymerase sigma-70 factor (ECF subfamily)
LELIQAARAGDPAAFHALVDRYAHSLFALAVSLSGNIADAEDMVQETFTGAFRGLGGFQGRASVKTWLSRILVRQAARHLRYARRRKATFVPLEATPDAAMAAASSHPGADTRMDVMAAIRSLSPEHQGVIVLRELEGLSYDEMAEVLQIPRGTVESRLFRARRALQEHLKEYFG